MWDEKVTVDDDVCVCGSTEIVGQNLSQISDTPVQQCTRKCPVAQGFHWC